MTKRQPAHERGKMAFFPFTCVLKKLPSNNYFKSTFKLIGTSPVFVRCAGVQLLANESLYNV